MRNACCNCKWHTEIHAPEDVPASLHICNLPGDTYNGVTGERESKFRNPYDIHECRLQCQGTYFEERPTRTIKSFLKDLWDIFVG